MTAKDLRGGMPIDTLRNVSYVEAIGCSNVQLDILRSVENVFISLHQCQTVMSAGIGSCFNIYGAESL